MKIPELVEGGLAVDDRGTVSYVNEVAQRVKRIYFVSNFERGFVRAWHGHYKEIKGVVVRRGAAIIIAMPFSEILWAEKYAYDDMATCNPDGFYKYTLTEKKPQILWIPKGYVNGFKTLTDNTEVMFLSTASLEESKNDDFRLSAEIFRYLWNVEER